MTTFRIQKRFESYTKIANEAIQDSRLSLKARGLHHLLLSYSDNWIVNIKHLTKQCDRDGRDSIYSAIKELKELGYIVQSRGRDDLGRLAEAKYDVYELPSDAPNPEKPEQAPPNPDYPDTANPDTANPDTANPDAYKEINSNKDLLEEINKKDKNPIVPLESAPTAKAKKAVPQKLTSGQMAELISLYNAQKPKRWSICQKMTPERERLANQLYKDCAKDLEQCKLVFSAALAWAKGDNWWSGDNGKYKAGGFESALRKNRYQTWAENLESDGGDPESIHQASDAGMTTADIRMAQRYQETLQLIQGLGGAA